jgi:hypothetical protein
MKNRKDGTNDTRSHYDVQQKQREHTGEKNEPFYFWCRNSTFFLPGSQALLIRPNNDKNRAKTLV